MAKPAILVVDDEDSSLKALTGQLESRYGTDYRIVSSASAAEALLRLEELRAEGAGVPLILADHWMPGITGTELLAQARSLHPTARRGLLIRWGDQSALAPMLQALSLGHIDCYVRKPVRSPDEPFHRTITELLDEWWRVSGRWFEVVTVVGQERSPRSHEFRDLLNRNGVPYGFYPASSEEGQALLHAWGVTADRLPAIRIYDGRILIDPTNAEVAEALGTTVRPSTETFDVVIVGGGPAGLAAAVLGASGGLTTALLEVEAFGGQAGTSSLIRNYLGFPRGISGAELASRAAEQAFLFGAQMIYGNRARSLRVDGARKVIGLSDGHEIGGRAIVLATGVSYRRLEVPALEDLVGAGVFYGAAIAEAQAMAGQRVLVVGGGNSAGQAAMHLARYAKEVIILVRSGSLSESMSEYLVTEIDNAPNIVVRYHAEIVGAGGEGKLERVTVRDQLTGGDETVLAAAVFILIGAEPFTDWLPQGLARDPWGYVLTGLDAKDAWSQERAPFLLETSIPGVFAVGDVRHGSIKRVASAVGEGSIALRFVHEYLVLSGDGS